MHDALGQKHMPILRGERGREDGGELEDAAQRQHRLIEAGVQGATGEDADEAQEEGLRARGPRQRRGREGKSGEVVGFEEAVGVEVAPGVDIHEVAHQDLSRGEIFLVGVEIRGVICLGHCATYLEAMRQDHRLAGVSHAHERQLAWPGLQIW